MHTIVQQDSYFTTMHDWLCHLATFCTTTYVKGGQVTKPIMHGCEIAILLNYCVHACLLSKRIYNKQLHCTQTSWPYLISELLVADLFIMLLLLGFAIFLHPRCFCLASITTECCYSKSQYSTLTHEYRYTLIEQSSYLHRSRLTIVSCKAKK